MLKIYINEKLIDIDDKFRGVPTEIISSLFSDKSTHSFPFMLPDTEQMQEALNFATIDNNYDNAVIHSILFVYNTLRISGTFKIIEIKDAIECYFISGTSSVIEKYKNLRLRDLSYSVSQDIDGAAASSYPTYAYTAHPIDITNDDLLAYFDDIIPEFLPSETKWKSRLFVNYPLTTGVILSGEIKPTNIISSQIPRNVHWIYSYLNPFFYISFVVKKIFETLGFNIISNVFETDSNLKKLCINYFNPKEAVGTIHLKDYVPDILAINFIKSLETFGVKVLFNLNKNQVRIINIIDKVNAAPIDNLTDITEKIKSHGITERFNFRLQYDLTQNDVYLDENDTFADLDYIDNVNNVKKDVPFNICPVDTFEDIASPPSPFLGVGYFLYSQDLGGGDTREYYRQWEIPKVSTKLKVGETDNTVLIYDGEQKLRISFFDNTITEAFRSFYDSDVGTTGTVAGHAYPAGLYYTATLNLKWGGTLGMLNKKMKPLFIWENSFKKPLKAKINLTSDKIAGIEDINTYTIDNYKCFISKLKITLKKNKIVLGDTELFTV